MFWLTEMYRCIKRNDHEWSCFYIIYIVLYGYNTVFALDPSDSVIKMCDVSRDFAAFFIERKHFLSFLFFFFFFFFFFQIDICMFPGIKPSQIRIGSLKEINLFSQNKKNFFVALSLSLSLSLSLIEALRKK